MIQIFEEAINNYSLPLAEEIYNAFNFTDYLGEERFHHGDKGCDCEMIRKMGDEEGRSVVNKLCKTHNVTCSKTGWELGWYRGQNKEYYNVRSTALPDGKTFKLICAICKKEFTSNQANCVYCHKCKCEAVKAKVKITYYKKTIPIKTI